MSRATQSETGTQLGLLWLQVSFLVPLASYAIGRSGAVGFRWMVGALVFGGVTLLVTRSLVRMWRVPPGEASRVAFWVLLATGLVWATISVGPLVEGADALATLTGALLAAIAVVVLCLTVREGVRLRRRVQSGS